MALTNIRKALQIEITVTLPDNSVLTFTEADVIRCVVSLRSDLSPINPTLPESEFEVDIYDPDITLDTVALLPDETPITYRTKESTNLWTFKRYFYTDEITYSDKVLHIHARDQVHKLDEEIAPIYIGQRWDGEANRATGRGLQYLYWLFEDIIAGTGTEAIGDSNKIEHLTYQGLGNLEGTYSTGDCVDAIVNRGTRRDIVAHLMNLCRFKFESGFLSASRLQFNLTYVDAGAPAIRNNLPYAKTVTIYEEDCGNIKEGRDRNVNKYNFRVCDVIPMGGGGYFSKIEGASADAIKQNGAAINHSGLSDLVYFGFRLNMYDPNYGGFFDLWELSETDSYYQRSRPYKSTFSFDYNTLRSQRYGYWLLDGDFQNNAFNFSKLDYKDLSGSIWTTETSPGISPSSIWQDYIDSGCISAGTTDLTLEGWGYYYSISDEKTYSVPTYLPGVIKDFEDIIWNGFVYAVNRSDNTIRRKMLPDVALGNLSKRSNICGSFTWRGDGSIQPRDLINFRLIEKNLLSGAGDQLTDESGNELIIGGYEYRTVETITTTHENGGTVSEITYRKGMI